MSNYNALFLGVCGLAAAVSAKPANDLIYYSTCDDVASIENPKVGPKGKVLNSRFVEGKKGKGFEVEGRRPGARINLPSGFFGPKGTIEFWAQIKNPKDYFIDGGDPRFFQVDNGVDFPIFFLEYAANDGGGNSGLHVLAVDNWQSSFGGFCGSMPYSKVLGEKKSEWHHYAVAWNRDADVKMSVYLDGVLQYSSKKFYSDEKLKECFGVPQILSFGMTETWHINLSKCTYVIDEFKVWSVEKKAFNLGAKPGSASRKPTPGGESVTITLSDGGVIKGALKEKTLHVNTLIGPLNIPSHKIQSVSFED